MILRTAQRLLEQPVVRCAIAVAIHILPNLMRVRSGRAGTVLFILDTLATNCLQSLHHFAGIFHRNSAVIRIVEGPDCHILIFWNASLLFA